MRSLNSRQVPCRHEGEQGEVVIGSVPRGLWTKGIASLVFLSIDQVMCVRACPCVLVRVLVCVCVCQVASKWRRMRYLL
jgi:hypothetical protein